MTRTPLAALACAIALMTASVSLSAQAPEPIRYTLRFPAPHTHYVDVEAVYPTGGAPNIQLFMAVWTPGSYLVREYERHVEGVVATANKKPLLSYKVAKNRWQIDTGGAPSVTVNYRVYGREMTVRTNWIEGAFAMLNGAPTFLSLVEGPDGPAHGTRPRAHEVRLELPTWWKTTSSPMVRIAGQPNAYRAEDFDTLVDSPIIAGNPLIKEFTVGGKKHALVVEGDLSFFDADRAVKDLQKIVETSGQIMGRFDYPHYHVMYVLTDAGGGLEHKNSFLGLAGRYTTRNHRAYLGWLGLTAHEYFHNWNVKRLRPVELGPFNYEDETYSRSLWIAEGFTDYYADVIVRRAGLSTQAEFLDALSDNIETVQTTPGRLITSVAQASFDTWVKQYRPDENTGNTTVNYYPKGALIGFLLDAKIRRATGGTKSLDDAMRLAYERYSGAKGYTLEEFFKTMSEAAGTDLRGFFGATVESTAELDYAEALDWYGLRFRAVDAATARPYLGMTTRVDGGRLLVSGVRREAPAFWTGINVDDEILAIDDVRVRADGLAARLDQYKPGDKISVLVARRDRLTKLDVALLPEPGRAWRLEVLPTATVVQKQRLAAWIGQ
ncbi:MAG TPA: PDZ domain-containing protein [Vicinamibacterales bacterium]|nr:PDZ domain-containing protein [Vicinamibacterales bacterium]